MTIADLSLVASLQRRVRHVRIYQHQYQVHDQTLLLQIDLDRGYLPGPGEAEEAKQNKKKKAIQATAGSCARFGAGWNGWNGGHRNEEQSCTQSRQYPIASPSDDHQPETLSLHHIIPHCHSTVHGAYVHPILNYLCSRTLPSKSNAPVWPVWEATRMQDTTTTTAHTPSRGGIPLIGYPSACCLCQSSA